MKLWLAYALIATGFFVHSGSSGFFVYSGSSEAISEG